MVESIPTIVVSRRVTPGKEREFERWNDRIREAAESWPGHLGSEAQPPGPAHPDEWIVVYRFSTIDQLEAWMRSEERRALLDEGDKLLDGPVREQRLVHRQADQAVTAIMTQRVPPEAHEDFRRAHAEITQVMRAFPGYLTCELAEPVPGVQEDHAVIFSFATRADLDRWLESDERRRVLALVDPLIEGERTLNVVGGFGGWFAPDRRHEPKRWKQAIAVLIALFPTALVLGFLLRSLLPDVPWALGVFISNVIGIAILTWLLMPIVTRVLAPWLKR